MAISEAIDMPARPSRLSPLNQRRWRNFRANGRPKALYEPVHGSAPDIAGQGKANPCACILSFAMALRYSFDEGDEATRLESAVESVLAKGIRTGDLMQAGDANHASTTEMGDAVLAELDASL